MVNSFSPKSLDEALKALKNHDYIPYAGGTDINSANISGRDIMFIGKIPELKTVKKEDGFIKIGACVTYAEAEKCGLIPTVFKEALKKVASPAIRNLGTYGGNLGNASGKADSALVIIVLDGIIHIRSAGGERFVPAKEFYKGYRQIDLNPDELITEILIPDRDYYENFYYDKISIRTSVAISNVTVAALWNIKNDVLKDFALGIGSATDTPIRCKDIEDAFRGRRLDEITPVYEGILEKYTEHIKMNPDRTSVYYRKRVIRNLLDYFIYSELTPIDINDIKEI